MTFQDFILAFYLALYLTYMPHSHHILSDAYSAGILSTNLIDIHPGILSGILSDVYADMSLSFLVFFF